MHHIIPLIFLQLFSPKLNLYSQIQFIYETSWNVSLTRYSKLFSIKIHITIVVIRNSVTACISSKVPCSIVLISPLKNSFNFYFLPNYSYFASIYRAYHPWYGMILSYVARDPELYSHGAQISFTTSWNTEAYIHTNFIFTINKILSWQLYCLQEYLFFYD